MLLLLLLLISFFLLLAHIYGSLKIGLVHQNLARDKFCWLFQPNIYGLDALPFTRPAETLNGTGTLHLICKYIAFA